MSTYAASHHDEQFSTGMAGSIVLHVVLAALIVAAAYLTSNNNDHWGEHAESAGAIQASMVSSIPLPQKAPPVKNAVLASDQVSAVPAPPPKEATQPPPKPTDVLVKAKTPDIKKVAPIPTQAPPKHPQPTPVTPKAATENAATQLPESVSQATNGTAAATIPNKAFGEHYAYYRDIISRIVSQNWYTSEADPRSSQGKHVLVTMVIQQDGSPTDIRIEAPSGSPSLDSSALHALERIETFGPLPAGNHLTVELSFDYHQP